MGKNSITNSEELALFKGLLQAAIVREHSVLPQVIGIAYLVEPGDWVQASALARSLNAAAEDFHTGLCETAVRHGLLSPGERLFPVCTMCGGTWCSVPLGISKKMAASWDVFVSHNKREEKS